MRLGRSSRRISILFLSFMMGAVTCVTASLAAAAIVVIGNPNIQVDHLTQNQVKNLYLGEPIHLSTGEVLQPYDHTDDSPVYQQFYQKLMGWSPSQVSSYWSSLIFRGEANPLPTVSDDNNAITVIESTPDAIAYIDSRDLSEAVGVKQLFQLGQPQNTFHYVEPDLKFTNTPHPIQQSNEVSAINQSLLNYQVGPPNTNLWPIVIAHFSLGNDDNQPDVQNEINYFMHNKKILYKMLNNAVPYLYYVYQQTQQRHMPAEFALLPMIESAYDPFAYSDAGASGLWQLMQGTATSLGLKTNWWYDGRRNVVGSTQTALNYLCSLHDSSHDWLLTAAAYDAGIGTVQTAQQYNRRMGMSTDFWNLSLPNETRWYVPELLALVDIIQHSAQYGVSLPYIPNKPYFSTVKVNSPIGLTKVAKLSGASPALIQRLNPGVLRGATSPSGSHTLLLPSSKIQSFKTELAKLNGQTSFVPQAHVLGISKQKFNDSDELKQLLSKIYSDNSQES